MPEFEASLPLSPHSFTKILEIVLLPKEILFLRLPLLISVASPLAASPTWSYSHQQHPTKPLILSGEIQGINGTMPEARQPGFEVASWAKY